MKLDFQQIFCEVLSGFVAILGALLWASVAQALEFGGVVEWMLVNPSIGKTTAVVVASYLVGLVIDALALVFDELVMDRWKEVKDHPRAIVRPLFLANVPDHVFSYWQTQWAYISCYRNLLILLPFVALPGAVLLNRAVGPLWTLWFLIASIGLGVCLVLTLKSLLRFYYGIESNVAEGVCVKPQGSNGQ